MEVTADMRDEFFEKNGYMGCDDDVEAWHKHEIEKNSEPETKPQCDGIKQICDNPDVNVLQINSMEDLNELQITGEEKITIKEEFLAFDTISIKDDNGKEYKYNPNSNRLTSLLRVVEDDDGVQIVGYVIDAGQVQPIVWNAESGNAYINFFKVDEYNLTPIKPKWSAESIELLQKTRKNITELIGLGDDIEIAEKFADIREILDDLNYQE